MLSPEEFKEEYPPEKLTPELPDSPVTSLRDIQYLYGKLYTLSTAGGGEYAAYLTPDAAGDLIDTDDSLIVVRVDLSGEEPKLAADPISVTRYEQNLVEQVAHSKYPAARGFDHSVTHQAGKNSDPEKLARYAKERLTEWASDDVIQEAAADHEDGWIIDALADLGEDEGVLETIEDGVEDALGGESTTALLTVQIKTDPDGDYRWPGDVDAFGDAMRARKLSKLVSKGEASNSAGEATDLVSGNRTRTVGTAEDPQNYFLGKQLETFPGLDPDEAWRSHPVSEDVAVTLMHAETFVEACTYYTFGTKVYYLPYSFGTPTPEDAYDLYGLLHKVVEDDEMTPIERADDERSNLSMGEDLRFYVSAVMAHQMSRYDVFGETMNGRLLYPRALVRAHDTIVRTDAFVASEDRTAPLPTNENWSLLAPDDQRLHSVSTGWYFAQTFAERDDADADADDPRIEALVSVLSGNEIAVPTLLSEYVARIIDEEGDDEQGFPSFLVAGQFAQLCALADDELDLLSGDSGQRAITKEPRYETPTPDTDGDIMTVTDGGDPRATKLESFIQDTPALAPGEGPLNDQRRGAFLLGALVGETGSYQSYAKNRSTTLIDQYPVKSITRNRVKKVTQEAIAKTLTYTREDNRSITNAEHIIERLRETILRPDPEEWELETDDLRFYYAFGVTYGMNDRTRSTDEAETAETA